MVCRRVVVNKEDAPELEGIAFAGMWLDRKQMVTCLGVYVKSLWSWSLFRVGKHLGDGVRRFDGCLLIKGPFGFFSPWIKTKI